jgi:hypothetical protein
VTTTDFLRPVFVETFPAVMSPGVLYISITYSTCGHLCCCGCEEEVITPLSPAQWSFTYDGENVSLTPSIGNWALPCQSHYWIRNGKAHWSRHYPATEIADTRQRDRRRLAEATRNPAPRRLAGLLRRARPWRR